MKSVAVLGEAEAPGATVVGDELGVVVDPGVTAGADPGLVGGAVVEVDGPVVVDELGGVVEDDAGVVPGFLVDGFFGSVVVVAGVVVGGDGLVDVEAAGSVVDDGVVVEVVAGAAPAAASITTTEVPIITARTAVRALRADVWARRAIIASLPLRLRSCSTNS